MYEVPEMEVVRLDAEDVVRTSGTEWDTDVVNPK